MRWKTEKPARPDYGQTRKRHRFAWLPTRLDDGMTVWLESYEVEEMFSNHGCWVETKRVVLDLFWW